MCSSERGCAVRQVCLGDRGLATHHVGSLFPNQKSNPHPLQWKCRVLTIGPPPGTSRRAGCWIEILVFALASWRLKVSPSSRPGKPKQTRSQSGTWEGRVAGLTRLGPSASAWVDSVNRTQIPPQAVQPWGAQQSSMPCSAPAVSPFLLPVFITAPQAAKRKKEPEKAKCRGTHQALQLVTPGRSDLFQDSVPIPVTYPSPLGFRATPTFQGSGGTDSRPRRGPGGPKEPLTLFLSFAHRRGQIPSVQRGLMWQLDRPHKGFSKGLPTPLTMHWDNAGVCSIFQILPTKALLPSVFLLQPSWPTGSQRLLAACSQAELKLWAAWEAVRQPECCSLLNEGQ